MKKKLIPILLIIVVLISLFFVYKNLIQKKETEINTNITQPIVQPEGLILSDSFETKVLNPSNLYVKNDVKYPYFKNASSDFNLKIENFIKKAMEDHDSLSKDNWMARYNTQVKGDNVPKVPATDADKFYFSSDFTIVQSNSTYISFVLNYGGFSGGAHGYENNISFNYDVKNQKNIELKDLFPNNTEYLNYLSTESRNFLEKQDFANVSEEDKKNSTPEAIKQFLDSITSSIEMGTEPKIENFSVFTFTPDKVKIYFGQYQVGPYVIGMPEVEIDIK
jgi:hypothetical protein